jgi:hypothetical protein
MSDEESDKRENEVDVWLKKIGYEDLIDKFRDGGYRNLTTISEMTKDDLKEIGIIAGFAKTILIHSVKLKKKEKKVIQLEDEDEEVISPKKSATCHNYSSNGHKKICSGLCEDFDECPTAWIEQHEEEHKKRKKEKEEEKKKQSEEKKRKRDDEKERKKEDQYKKIPLKPWKEFYAERKDEITNELFGEEEVNNIKKQKIIVEISKRYKDLLKETEEENEKRKKKKYISK